MGFKNYTVCPHCNEKIDEKDIQMIMVMKLSQEEIESMKKWDLIAPDYETCEKCPDHAPGLGCVLDDILECPYKKKENDN